MLVTWLGHAQLFINAAGKTLLVDPWFVEPAEGLHRYPPPPFADASSVPRPDFVLLSTLNDLHASRRTLETLSADSTFVVPSTALEQRVREAGKTKVMRLETSRRTMLTQGLFATALRNDEVGFCLVIEGDEVKVVHGGMGPLSAATCAQVARPVQLAFVPVRSAVDELMAVVEALRPEEVAPIGLNAVATEGPMPALSTGSVVAAAMGPAHRLGVRVALFEPGDEWSPDTGVIAKGACAGWGWNEDGVARAHEKWVGA